MILPTNTYCHYFCLYDDIISYDIGTLCSMVIAKALSANCNLYTLKLSDNDIGNEKVIKIAKILCSNYTLSRIQLKYYFQSSQ